MKKAIWLTYDLGVRGDYEGMYAWLDGHGAKECGDSLAFLNYEVKSDLLGELKADLANAVELKSKRVRIYVVYLDAAKKVKGSFLFGNRRSPRWAGFAGVDTADDNGDEM